VSPPPSSCLAVGRLWKGSRAGRGGRRGRRSFPPCRRPQPSTPVINQSTWNQNIAPVRVSVGARHFSGSDRGVAQRPKYSIFANRHLADAGTRSVSRGRKHSPLDAEISTGYRSGQRAHADIRIRWSQNGRTRWSRKVRWTPGTRSSSVVNIDRPSPELVHRGVGGASTSPKNGGWVTRPHGDGSIA